MPAAHDANLYKFRPQRKLHHRENKLTNPTKHLPFPLEGKKKTTAHTHNIAKPKNRSLTPFVVLRRRRSSASITDGIHGSPKHHRQQSSNSWTEYTAIGSILVRDPALQPRLSSLTCRLPSNPQSPPPPLNELLPGWRWRCGWEWGWGH